MKRSTILHDVPITFIGAGAMGEAMIGGLLRHKLVEPDAITAADRHPERLNEVRDLFHVHTTRDNRIAARNARVVVLSVKPQVLTAVYADLKGALRPSTLVVSIVAGARIASIAAGLGHKAIVRTMPNTPAQVGEGMTVWTATDAVSDTQRDQAGAILSALGKQLYVQDEGFLDKATAVSGSGPAYVFLLMEALIDAAVHLGWSRADARVLVIQTVRGAAIFAERSPVHPAEMQNYGNVTGRDERRRDLSARKGRLPHGPLEGGAGCLPTQRRARRRQRGRFGSLGSAPAHAENDAQAPSQTAVVPRSDSDDGCEVSGVSCLLPPTSCLCRALSPHGVHVHLQPCRAGRHPGGDLRLDQPSLAPASPFDRARPDRARRVVRGVDARRGGTGVAAREHGA